MVIGAVRGGMSAIKLSADKKSVIYRSGGGGGGAPVSSLGSVYQKALAAEPWWRSGRSGFSSFGVAGPLRWEGGLGFGVIRRLAFACDSISLSIGGWSMRQGQNIAM